MADFSVKQAAFEGWGLMKRKPGMFLVLALFCFVVNMVGYWLIMGAAGETMARMMEMRRSGDMSGMSDPAFAMQMMGASGKLYAIAAVMGALSYMVSAGAVARAVIRPSTSKMPYIGLGADEFRLLAVGVVVGLILFAISLVGIIVIGIAAGVTAAATGGLAAMAETPGEMPPVMAAVSYGGSALLYFLVFLFSVRFSLAPAQSEREEGVRIFGSWALSKGRYWPMVGAYLLAMLTLVPFYLVQTGILTSMAMSGGLEMNDAIMASTQPDWSAESLFSPTVLTFVVLNSLVVALAWIVCLGSSFSVYAQTQGIATTEHNVEDDDDDDDDDDD